MKMYIENVYSKSIIRKKITILKIDLKFYKIKIVYNKTIHNPLCKFS